MPRGMRPATLPRAVSKLGAVPQALLLLDPRGCSLTPPRLCPQGSGDSGEPAVHAAWAYPGVSPAPKHLLVH